jgi:hypothetical protein
LSSAFPGAPESDAYEYARHIWWYGYALQHGLPLFQHPYLAYPDGISGWWLWAIPLQSFPAWLFDIVMPLPLAYNLMTLIRLTLNGWTMFLLVRRLTNSAQAGMLAGAVFLLYPTMQGHLFASHVGILALWPIPLYADSLLRLRGTANRRWIGLAGLWFVVSTLGSAHLLIFVLFPLTLTLTVWALAARDWRWLRAMIGALILGGALLSVFLLPAIWEQLNDPSAVSPGGLVNFSTDLLGFVSPSFFHPLYQALDYPRAVLGVRLVEGSAYVGIIAAALALVGLWRKPAARVWGWLALLAVVLSLGVILKVAGQPIRFMIDGVPFYVPLPFALLADLPLVNIIRTPGRFNIATGFAIAIMAGYGVAALLQAIPRRGMIYHAPTIVTVVLIALVAFDTQLAWEGVQPKLPLVDATLPAALVALAEDDSIEAVLNLPINNLIVAKHAMYLQVAHQHPILDGFVSRQTPVSAAKLGLLQSTLDPALLQAAGADVVIVWHQWDAAVDERAAAQLGAPFYRDGTIAAYRVPPTEVAPDFTVQTFDDPVIRTHADLYAYAPAPLWATLTATLTGQRAVSVTLDGEPIARYTLTGDAFALDLPVPLAVGYRVVSIQLDPPCPDVSPDPNLICNSVLALEAALTRPHTATLTTPIRYANGITLQSAVVGDAFPADVALYWTFDEGLPNTLGRFVHVLDANDHLVASSDVQPGVFAAGEGLADAVTLNWPLNLPAGDYRVMAGWYTYPDITRIDVLDNVAGAEVDLAQVGAFSVP